MSSTMRPFSSAEALRIGWQLTRSHLKPLLAIGAVGAFLALLNQALATPAPADGLRALMLLLIQILQVAVTLVWIRAALQLHDSQQLEWSRPSALLGDFFTFLLTSVLYGLLVGLGLLLLVVPGIIWALQFGFCGYFVADKKLDPIEALRASSRLTKGVKKPLFVFALLVMATNFVGMLALGVGLFVTLPTTFIAAAYVFRRLQAHAASRIQPPSQAPALGLPTPSGAV